MTFKHQIFPNGSHRIVILDGKMVVREGEVTSYQLPACLIYSGNTYAAFTQYYDGSMPVERVLLLTEAGK